MENKERFISLMSNVKRDGVDKLMEWLASTDFYTAPASSRYHGCYAGGLLQHSLNVYDEMKRILSIYPEYNFSEETICIVSLLHDLTKIDMYKPDKRNKKNPDTGKWEAVDCYTIEDRHPYGGHGCKSVYLIQSFIKLTYEEAVAVQNHMGFGGEGEVARISDAYSTYPLAVFLHWADESATFLIESKE